MDGKGLKKQLVSSLTNLSLIKIRKGRKPTIPMSLLQQKAKIILLSKNILETPEVERKGLKVVMKT